MSLTITYENLHTYTQDQYPKITHMTLSNYVGRSYVSLPVGFTKKFPNLKLLTLCSIKLSSLVELGGLDNIQELCLVSCEIDTTKGCSKLTSLKSLTLFATGNTKLEDLDNITSLSMSHAFFIELFGMPNLTKLDVVHSQITLTEPLCGVESMSVQGADDLSFLSMLPNLRHLEVKGPVRYIYKLPLLPSVSDLKWLGGDNIHVMIRCLPNLTNLIIRRASLYGINKESVERLQHLTINECSIHSRTLSSISAAKNLVYLNLKGNNLENIEFLAPLVQLQYLDIGRNKIEDIKPLKSLVNLRKLNVSKNPVRDVLWLTTLPKLECIKCTNGVGLP